MPYCTLTDIRAMETEEVLIQLTDERGEGAIDESKVTAAIAAADDEANLYLRAKYPTIPIPAPIPGMLLRISRDIAIYELYSRRVQGEMPKNIEERAERARQYLRDLQAGKASLGIEPASGPGHFSGNKTCEDRIFTDQNLKAYKAGGI